MNAAPEFVDIHQHLLFGVDDGAGTRDAMHAMLDAAYQDGTRTVIATPHARPGVCAFERELCRERLCLARQYCREKGYSLRVLEGAEVLLTPSAVSALSGGRIPTLNGTDYVLVEWPAQANADQIESDLRALTNEGMIPVLAHAERLHCFWLHPARLLEFRGRLEIRIQIDAETVLRPAGIRSGLLARRLLREKAVDYVASDAHDLSRRKTRMSEAYARLAKEYGARTAEKMMGLNQREILAENV